MHRARAVKIREHGGPEVLELGEIEVRDPGPGELLVEVAAAGLNRADTLQRRGFYPAPPGVPSDVPGLEYAGTVVGVGEGVSAFGAGDRVMGIVAGGGMATHLVTHEREALPVPAEMSLTDAAAIPEVFMTAYDAMFAQGELGIGQTVVLHAVGSGVGTAALQLALCAGARPIGTSRTADKIERCRELGLSDGIVVTDGKFAAAVKEKTAGRGADLIVDVVGAAYLAENVSALATAGRIVVLGLMGGIAGELPLGPLLAKRALVRGSILRARPLEQKAALSQSFIRDVLPLFAAKRLTPVIDATLPMKDIPEAHRRMETNTTFGKLILTW